MKNLPHLLLVDDEELNRLLTCARLQEHGCQISEAANGKEALELIKKNEYDLILLDFSMPEMNGLEVLTQIRLQYSSLQLPVIMLTANDSNTDIINAFHIGANDYILKPLNHEVAAARIHTHLSQSHLAKLKDSFLQFASHDLKKPLLVINDIASELKNSLVNNYNIDEDTQSLLELIITTSCNTQNMIHGFLDKNNQPDHSALNIQILNLNEIVNNIIKHNQNYSQKKSVRLVKNISSDDYKLYSDSFRVTRILENLLDNAIKFSPPNTTIEIVTQLKNNILYIEVRDNGPGILNNEFPLLFKKHATLSNKPTGNEISSGIGLDLCYELAKQINAKIGARNNQSGGATFFLEFRLQDKDYIHENNLIKIFN